MSVSEPSAAGHLVALTEPQRPRLRRAAGMATLAEALWIAQASCVAMALAALAGAEQGDARLRLVSGSAGFFLLGLLRAGLITMAGRGLARVGDTLIGVLREDALTQGDRRGSLPDAAHSAAIAALMTDKLALLLPYLRRWPVARMRVAVIPLLIILITLPISWAAALIMAITGPLIPVFMALVGMAAGRASQERMDEIADLNGLLTERLGALTDLRLLAAAPAMLQSFATSADHLRGRSMRVLSLAFLSSTVLELFSAIGVAMMALYVGFSLLGLIDFGTWGTNLGLMSGIFLLLLAPSFYQPMRDLAAAWHDRADALALARDLMAETERPVPSILGQGSFAKPIAFDGLRTEGLRIGDRALPDLTLRPGDSVALTGRSGAGKSWLIAILAGLADPAPGKVLLGTTQLSPENADAWRAGLALIPQRVHFADEPLAMILTGGRELGPAKMEQALALAGATDIVARLPQGLETRLGEQGAGVSGGEARRLMIARAALRHPALLLADEPTADLDDETAELVISGLLALHQQGTTLVAASHDPRLIAAMSRQIAVAG